MIKKIRRYLNAFSELMHIKNLLIAEATCSQRDMELDSNNLCAKGAYLMAKRFISEIYSWEEKYD